ncbi:hypothetical protein [Acidovorax sp.]|uniref:hypothetical protein n=1 Tax=Acidovorax sp. TaxID=1872122 RepID=UPI003D032451
MSIRNKKYFFKRQTAAAFAVSLILTACTSVGHLERTQPQIERKLANRPNVVAVVGSGELAVAVELLLVSKGISVRASPVQVTLDSNQNVKSSETVARYVANVTSVDHDMCVPEGSRQMHFHISVVDLVSNERVFAMSGDYGCKNTIVQRFDRWFFQ